MEFGATGWVVKIENMEQHRKLLAEEEEQIKTAQQNYELIINDSTDHINNLYDKYLKQSKVRNIVQKLFDDIKESKNTNDVVYNEFDIENIPENHRVSNKYKNRYEKGRKFIILPEK